MTSERASERAGRINYRKFSTRHGASKRSGIAGGVVCLGAGGFPG